MPSWLVTTLLNWLWGKVSALIAAAWKKVMRQKEIDKESEQSVEPLKRAQTAKEIDDAADDALSGF